MPSLAQRLSSLFRMIVMTMTAALLIVAAAIASSAQNSVPLTARQAMTMPQYAAKLAHGASRVAYPVQPRASDKNPANALARAKSGWLPQGNDLYDNGPVNGTTDAWTIDFGFVISDTFTVPSGSSPATGVSFYAWTYPGDVLQTAEVIITSSEFGGTVYSDQVVNFSQSQCSANQYGFNVCLETSANFNGPNLNGGTYWVNLANAVVNDGDPIYWDENSGVGCGSQGCPSEASNNSVGTIPSEAFTVEGQGCQYNCEPPPQCYQSGGNLQTIYNFTEQQGLGTAQGGVAIDRAGNLYGANPDAGNNSAGLAYKLARFADWLLDPLFSFFGGYTGGNPTGAIVGPNGTLYGGAYGGIQNCGSDGSQYCGVVYNLTPPPTACLTALCSWNESVPYRFSSESDGSGVINVSAYDRQGNLYGTTSTGGAYDAGTVFELTPSGGGWTKTTLYSFTGGNDGATPTQVLAGNDGNLYGVAGGGLYGSGVVFQLTPSGGQWIESVLHAFSGGDGDGSGPGYPVQDSAGNLYGIATVYNLVGMFPDGVIFVLEKTGSGWAFNEEVVQHSCMPGDLPFENLNNLTIDNAGNLYGTGTGGATYFDSPGKRRPYAGQCNYGFIFKASYDSNGWHYQDLDFLNNQYFNTAGTLAIDPSGNLYGTTAGCTDNNGTDYGTVWQLSP